MQNSDNDNLFYHIIQTIYRLVFWKNEFVNESTG
jgi:hypothetical protein